MRLRIPLKTFATFLVGLTADNPQSDSCEFGGSGSVAMFANGKFSGPLSFRNNIGYGDAHSYASPDNAVDNQRNRLEFEASTKLNLGQFTTVCGFSVPSTAEVMPDLISVLQHPSEVITAKLDKGA
ncbi:MAG TPA: hypothetical protein VFN56_03200 [Candidatus Saccharimonadales bacterium]|nr:hypothetical protein [Candidatus Saccharimonadales bacterium]